MSTTPSSAIPQERRLKVFLCHSSGDKGAVRELYAHLKKDGFAPWLDEEDLLPGQFWQDEIPVAVRASDVVLVCLSQKSVSKEGYLQKEIRDALSAAEEKPEGTIFIIPVRLEQVEVPRRLSQWQWANLFQEDGYERLARALAARAATVHLAAAVPATNKTLPALEVTESAQAPQTSSVTSSRPRFMSLLFRGKRRTLISVTCVVVVLALAYVAYLYQASKKRQEISRILQEDIKKDEQTEAATAAELKAVESKPQATPSASSPFSIPQKNQGELRFDSRPQGAQVTVDGWSEPTWITPFAASSFSAGGHTVLFVKDRYVQETQTVIVVAGKSIEVSADLMPTVSTLKVSSTPPGAIIEVDGNNTNKITPDAINLEKGEHIVTLHKEGYSDVSTKLTLAEGASTTYSPVLLPPSTEMSPARSAFWKKVMGSSRTDPIPPGKGVVRIHTAPTGATIQVGDKVAIHKTDVWWAVDPGTYDILLILDGYKPAHRTVQVKKGQEVDVDEILQPQ